MPYIWVPGRPARQPPVPPVSVEPLRWVETSHVLRTHSFRLVHSFRDSGLKSADHLAIRR
jgi:hypothetical protein